MVLFHEFKFFFNLFFLLIALSQLVPFLKVGKHLFTFSYLIKGLLITYVAPLAFVLFITMCKEAFDDVQRYRRDKELNTKKHEILTNTGYKTITSQNLRVGQIVKVHQNERLPADLILLYTTEKTGSVFIRTDQLDGETDWKLRKAVPITQKISPPETIFFVNGYVKALPPNDQIYNFQGFMKDEVS